MLCSSKVVNAAPRFGSPAVANGLNLRVMFRRFCRICPPAHVQVVNVRDQQVWVLALDLFQMFEVIADFLPGLVFGLPISPQVEGQILFKLLGSVELFRQEVMRHMLLKKFENFVEYQQSFRPNRAIVQS